MDSSVAHSAHAQPKSSSTDFPTDMSSQQGRNEVRDSGEDEQSGYGDIDDAAAAAVPAACSSSGPAPAPGADGHALTSGTANGEATAPAASAAVAAGAADAAPPSSRGGMLKTSLCSFFRSGKHCKQGDSCRFAHGEEELKRRPDGTWDPTSLRGKEELRKQKQQQKQQQKQPGPQANQADGVQQSMQEASTAATTPADVDNEVKPPPWAAAAAAAAEAAAVAGLDGGVGGGKKARLCVRNMPAWWKVADFRSFLSTIGLPHSTGLRKQRGYSTGFVSFASQEEASAAVEALSGHTVHGHMLEVSQVEAKRWGAAALNASDGEEGGGMGKENGEGDGGERGDENGSLSGGRDGRNDEGVEAAGGIQGGGGGNVPVGEGGSAALQRKEAWEAVTPLANLPYETQLRDKSQRLEQILKKLVRKMRKKYPRDRSVLFPPWLAQAGTRGGLPCTFEGVVASPVVDGYRNKCEFTIGESKPGVLAVGFLLGNFREGVTAVGEPTACRNVSTVAKAYARVVQRLLQQSPLPPWSKRSSSGFWRLLIVREGRGPLPVMPVCAPRETKPDYARPVGHAQEQTGVEGRHDEEHGHAAAAAMASAPVPWHANSNGNCNDPDAATAAASHAGEVTRAVEEPPSGDAVGGQVETAGDDTLVPCHEGKGEGEGQVAEKTGAEEEGASVPASERRTKEVLLMLQINPTGVDPALVQSELSRVVDGIKQAARDAGPAALPLTVILTQEHAGVSNAAPETCPMQLLYSSRPATSASTQQQQISKPQEGGAVQAKQEKEGGNTASIDRGVDGSNRSNSAEAAAAQSESAMAAVRKGELSIYDHLCGLQFRVSPTAFFQVNTAGAEKLYSLAAQWMDLGSSSSSSSGNGELVGSSSGSRSGEGKLRTLVLDVCCGTGTIGMVMALHASHVIGVDINAAAIADATSNARANGLTNCHFIAGAAEDVLPKLLRKYTTPKQTPLTQAATAAGPRPAKADAVAPSPNPAETAAPEAGAECITGKRARRDDDGAAVSTGGEAEASEGKRARLDSPAQAGSAADASTAEAPADAPAAEAPEARAGPDATSAPSGPVAVAAGAAAAQGVEEFDRIVAVVDPPRSGLHPIVIRALKENRHIKQLLYISCNAETMLDNAIELCAPAPANVHRGGATGSSKAAKKAGASGDREPPAPFAPVRACGVDMFPHTPHCEVAVLFVRE